MDDLQPSAILTQYGRSEIPSDRQMAVKVIMKVLQTIYDDDTTSLMIMKSYTDSMLDYLQTLMSSPDGSMLEATAEEEEDDELAEEREQVRHWKEKYDTIRRRRLETFNQIKQFAHDTDPLIRAELAELLPMLCMHCAQVEALNNSIPVPKPLATATNPNSKSDADQQSPPSAPKSVDGPHNAVSADDDGHVSGGDNDQTDTGAVGSSSGQHQSGRRRRRSREALKDVLFDDDEEEPERLSQYCIPIIVRLLTDEMIQVRKTCQTALFIILEQEFLDTEVLEKSIIPVLIRQSEPDSGTSDETRIETVQLLCKIVTSNLDADRAIHLFLELFTRLCMEEKLFHIRKQCAGTLGDMSTLLGAELTERVLVPHLLTLSRDNVWGVRKACAENYTAVSYNCTMSTRKRRLAPQFISLLTDQSRWVQSSAFQHLGPFIATFADPNRTGLRFNHDGQLTYNQPSVRSRLERDLSECEALLIQSQIELPPGVVVPDISHEDAEDEEESAAALGDLLGDIGFAALQDAADGEEEEDDEEDIDLFPDDSSQKASSSVDDSAAVESEDQASSSSATSSQSTCTGPSSQPGATSTDSPDGRQYNNDGEFNNSLADTSPSGSEQPNDEESKLMKEYGSFGYWRDPPIDVDVGVIDNGAEGRGSDQTNSKQSHQSSSFPTMEDALKHYIPHSSTPSQRKNLMDQIKQYFERNEKKMVFSPSVSWDKSGGGDGSEEGGNIDGLLELIKTSSSDDGDTDVKDIILNLQEDNNNQDSSPSPSSSSELHNPSSSSSSSSSKSNSASSSSSSVLSSITSPRNPIKTVLEKLHSHKSPDKEKGKSTKVDGGNESSKTGDGSANADGKNNNQQTADDSNQSSTLSAELSYQDIIPQALLDNFVSMAEPTKAQTVESEIARYCAYNLPAVALTMGRQFWPLIRPTYNALANDMQWKVRRTLAFSLHEIAAILGPELTQKDLIPIYTSFIRDLDEVRTGILRHLCQFVQLLDENVREQVLKNVAEFLQTDNARNWRFRMELAEQLIPLCQLYTPSQINEFISPIGMTLATDRVADIRRTAYKVLASILQHFYIAETTENEKYLDTKSVEQWGAHMPLTDGLVEDIVGSFAKSQKYVRRQSFAYICKDVIENNWMSPAVFEHALLEPFIQLATDPIPNVKIVFLRSLKFDYFSSEPKIINRLEEVIKGLIDDRDLDVKRESRKVLGLPCAELTFNKNQMRYPSQDSQESSCEFESALSEESSNMSTSVPNESFDDGAHSNSLDHDNGNNGHHSSTILNEGNRHTADEICSQIKEKIEKLKLEEGKLVDGGIVNEGAILDEDDEEEDEDDDDDDDQLPALLASAGNNNVTESCSPTHHDQPTFQLVPQLNLDDNETEA